MRATPVSVCVAVISAPGNTAPLGSLTVPEICAVACDQTSALLKRETRKAKHRYLTSCFICPPILQLTSSQITYQWPESINLREVLSIGGVLTTETQSLCVSVVNKIFISPSICE